VDGRPASRQADRAWHTTDPTPGAANAAGTAAPACPDAPDAGPAPDAAGASDAGLAPGSDYGDGCGCRSSGTNAAGTAALLLLLGRQDPHAILREVEWPTLFFFVGLFIVVGGVEEVGILEDVGEWIADVTDGSPTGAAFLILWVSTLLSGIVDNIPYTAAMIPVVREIEDGSGSGAQSDVLWWALALGAGLGGNLTVIAASANVLVANLAERGGERIPFWEFFRYGALVTVGSTLVSTLYLGGWQIPWALEEQPVLRTALQFGTFFLKSYFWVLVAVWLRWTLPRIRVDQMMSMCWKYLVPLALVNLLATATWMVVFPEGTPRVTRALCALVGVMMLLFAWRVVFHVRRAGLLRGELSFNPLATARSPR
jgi:hypothetical protein